MDAAPLTDMELRDVATILSRFWLAPLGDQMRRTKSVPELFAIDCFLQQMYGFVISNGILVRGWAH